MKKYIKGMSFSRSETIAHIQQYIEKSLDHFICLVLFPSCWSDGHWMTEIYGHLHEVSRTSYNKKRFPEFDLIYAYTYGKRQDKMTDLTYFSARAEDMEDKENLRREVDIEYAMNLVDKVCADYYTWLADILSKIGYVTCKQVKEKIVELIEKHK